MRRPVQEEQHQQGHDGNFGNSSSPPPLKKAAHKPCSNPAHSTASAVLYCVACSKFFCRECAGHHSVVFPEHASSTHTDLQTLHSLFTGKCHAHPDGMLDYLCTQHNVLCCSKCKLTKDDVHAHCNVIPIDARMCDELPGVVAALSELVRRVKGPKLEALEEKQAALDAHVEATKMAVTTAFKKIRNALNEREKRLMEELEEARDKLDRSELIQEVELSKEAEDTLLEAKQKKVMLGDDSSNYVTVTTAIRDTVNCVCKAKEAIEHLKTAEQKVDASIRKEDVVEFEWDKSVAGKVSNFGCITKTHEYSHGWKECPDNVITGRKYFVSGENSKVATKRETDSNFTYCTIIGNTALPINKLVSWGIKILKSKKQ